MREFDLLSELPTPGPDEPQSLRQDIADELADHLACATQHKMIGGLDTETAWKQAVLQFGNPQQTARQLWWQAMRNRIMSQRLTMVFTGLAMVACTTMLVIVLMIQQQMHLQSQQQTFLAETMQGFQEAFNKSQETLSRTAPARFSVEVRTNSLEDKIPRYASAKVTGIDLTNKEVSGTAECDANTGRADFGDVPPGRYRLKVNANREEYTEIVELEGGTSYVNPIVCDRVEELSSLPVEIDFKMPTANSLASLSKRGLVIFAGFRRQPKVVQSFVWKPLSDWEFLGLLKSDEGLKLTESGHYFSPLPMRGLPLPVNDLYAGNITTADLQLRTARPRSSERLQYSILDTIQAPIPTSWTFRLERLGILSDAQALVDNAEGGVIPTTNLTIVMWDQSHPHFPAWAKEPGHVFVVNDKASGSPSQRSLPWQIEVPAELIDEALAASNPESPTN